MTRNKTGLIWKSILSILAVAIIIGYTIFNSRIFIAGPQLTISNPTNGETISDSPLVRVEGSVEHISSIKVNDKMFPIDSNGNFTESILLKPGHNIIYIKAQDKFGRCIEEKLELFYTGSTPEILIPEEEPVEEENITESLENI